MKVIVKYITLGSRLQPQKPSHIQILFLLLGSCFSNILITTVASETNIYISLDQQHTFTQSKKQSLEIYYDCVEYT